MDKNQHKEFKKITKGTKKNPTTVIITWDIWHSLSTRIQTSPRRNFIIFTENSDWNEDVYTIKRANDIVLYHNMSNKLIVAGDTDHIKHIVDDHLFTIDTTVFDINDNIMLDCCK